MLATRTGGAGLIGLAYTAAKTVHVVPAPARPAFRCGGGKKLTTRTGGAGPACPAYGGREGDRPCTCGTGPGVCPAYGGGDGGYAGHALVVLAL